MRKIRITYRLERLQNGFSFRPKLVKRLDEIAISEVTFHHESDLCVCDPTRTLLHEWRWRRCRHGRESLLCCHLEQFFGGWKQNTDLQRTQRCVRINVEPWKARRNRSRRSGEESRRGGGSQEAKGEPKRNRRDQWRMGWKLWTKEK